MFVLYYKNSNCAFSISLDQTESQSYNKIRNSYFSNMPTATITKATSRGQITLPKVWRDRFKTDQYILRADDFKLEIAPVDEEELEWLNGETIFNADRDNGGKGIEAGEFIRMLRNIDRHEQNRKTARQSNKKRPRQN